MTATRVAVCLERGTQRSAFPLILERLGLDSAPSPRCRWHEPGLLTIELSEPPSPERMQDVLEIPGVERALPIPPAGALVSHNGTRVAVKVAEGVTLGGGRVSVIAGPCSVESEAQVCEIAAEVKAAGAVALRGGVFKPRTSPYAFGGLGEEGLGHLARARALTGLPIVTEALDTSCLDAVARCADVIQIGARNMQNFPLLFAVGSHPAGRPVLLKRGFAATLDELLASAEYILLGRLYAGHTEPGVILCERGIRTFDDATRFTLDVGGIVALKERTRLPVIADPSHAAGFRRYVPALACAAVGAGADGLLVEVHNEPGRAWSDAEQCIDPATFVAMMQTVSAVAAAVRA